MTSPSLTPSEERPLLLDAFCGAGGCTKGYQRAGFRVVGVDIKPQPNYCGDEFIQMDALEFLAALVRGERVHGYVLADFAAIHASPPCQAWSAGRHMPGVGTHVDLIAPTRSHLRKAGLPYVIENVVGAALVSPVPICGTSLGLGADGHDLARHRLFETSFPVQLFSVPPCSCGGRPVIGLYGDRAKTSRGATLTERSSRWSRPSGLVAGSEAMGIDWMTWRELTQAIPPAFTELLGHQLLAHIQAEAVAA